MPPECNGGVVVVDDEAGRGGEWTVCVEKEVGGCGGRSALGVRGAGVRGTVEWEGMSEEDKAAVVAEEVLRKGAERERGGGRGWERGAEHETQGGGMLRGGEGVVVWRRRG